MKRKTKWTLIIFSCFVFTGGTIYAEPYVDHNLSATNLKPLVMATVEAGVTMEAKVAATKSELVESLAKECETQGAKEPDAVIILDSNNEMSLGAFQFQIKTIQHFEKELYGKDISRADAIRIAIDHQEASQLAMDILFKVSGGWKNWLNCGQKLDLPIQIELLRKLEK